MSETTPEQRQVAADLDALQATERRISDRRRELHQRIDQIYLEAPLDDGMLALLDQLEKEEREISGMRYRLHRRIDTLRAEIGLPSYREEHTYPDAVPAMWIEP